MIWSIFSDFYTGGKEGVAWVAWDPELQHRGIKMAQPHETVNIEQSSLRYAPDSQVKRTLDHIFTKEIYQHVTSGNIDPDFLLRQGFEVIKNSNNLVLAHANLDEWIIKISTQETRPLPMESTVKAQLALKHNEQDRAWLPLRNTNLLRAEGRAYFVKQLAGLKPQVQDIFEFPKEHIYRCPHALNADPDYKKYFSISEKKKVLSGQETVDVLSSLDSYQQRTVASMIVALLKKVRMHDLHKGNLVLDKAALAKGKMRFVALDCEPLGIMIDSNDNGAHLFNPIEHVLFCLISFRDCYCRANGLTAMAEVADQAIVDYLEEHKEVNNRVASDAQPFIDSIPTSTFQHARTIALIIISIICPLIPLILLIIAIFQAVCCDSEDPDDPAYGYEIIHTHTPGMIRA